MADIKITNMAKFYTLCLLSENPVHGYEIIKEVGKRIGSKISPGQIYPFLKKLKEENLIKISETGNREKKQYMFTSKGRKFTDSLLSKFADMVSVSIGKNIKKCTHCDCEVYRGGVVEKGRLFCCKPCAKALKN